MKKKPKLSQFERDRIEAMLKLTLAYTRYFNDKYKGVGQVWQGRYKSSLIDTDDYFIWCGIYTELNPVRVGLVKNPEDWMFSSFRYYASGEENYLSEDLIDPDPFYLALGDNAKGRAEQYRGNIQSVMKEDFLTNLRQALNQGVFGKETFLKEMKEKFNIRLPQPKGRPRKNQS